MWFKWNALLVASLDSIQSSHFSKHKLPCPFPYWNLPQKATIEGLGNGAKRATQKPGRELLTDHRFWILPINENTPKVCHFRFHMAVIWDLKYQCMCLFSFDCNIIWVLDVQLARVLRMAKSAPGLGLHLHGSKWLKRSWDDFPPPLSLNADFGWLSRISKSSHCKM